MDEGLPIENRIPCFGSTRETGDWAELTFSQPGGGDTGRFPSHPAVNHAALSSFSTQRVSSGMTGVIIST